MKLEVVLVCFERTCSSLLELVFNQIDCWMLVRQMGHFRKDWMEASLWTVSQAYSRKLLLSCCLEEVHYRWVCFQKVSQQAYSAPNHSFEFQTIYCLRKNLLNLASHSFKAFDPLSCQSHLLLTSLLLVSSSSHQRGELHLRSALIQTYS